MLRTDQIMRRARIEKCITYWLRLKKTTIIEELIRVYNGALSASLIRSFRA